MSENKGGHQNSYPFATKAQIKAKIASDDSFVVECVQVLQARQTEQECETGSTSVKNRRGWMSSHAVALGKISAKITAGEDLSVDETAKARDACSHYTKQLASALRETAIEADPSLADKAAVFFTKK